MAKLPKSEQQQRDDNFREVISGRLEQIHITRTELGRRLDLSPGTMCNRWANPDSFTRAELRKMCNILNIGCDRLINSTTI